MASNPAAGGVDGRCRGGFLQYSCSCYQSSSCLLVVVIAVGVMEVVVVVLPQRPQQETEY